MTNTVNTNYSEAKKVAKLVLQDLYKKDVKVETKEDMFNTVCNYVQLTKEQFEQFYEEAVNAVNEGFWGTEELDDDELEMVAGGVHWDRFAVGLIAAIAGIAGTAACTVMAFVGGGPAAVGGIAMCATMAIGGVGIMRQAFED